MRSRTGCFRLVAALLLLAGMAYADVAAFDLSGPRVEVKVTRGDKTLPIAQVPNLQAGDRLWVRPDMPEGQSARYLLIATFLRGATNPPPENWFTKADTLSRQMREEGIVLTVPQDAQQALLFLAPQTGGDFGSLRSTVRGKPGAFVRASQDLNQASKDRSRLDRYLAAIRQIAESEPAALHERSVLLARSLNMKVDEQCFDKPSSQQAPCLMQNTDQLVLEEGGQGTSLVSTLTSGAGSDLIGQVSATRAAGGGAYSAYVGAVVDVVRLMEGFHTPSYQYIPALVTPKREQLNLRLNNPPSFRKPKSVLVVSLPQIDAAQTPQIRPVDPNQVGCVQNPSLVLPIQGAPLVFSTEMAHDMVLHLEDKAGQVLDLPVAADPARGGLVFGSHAIDTKNLATEITGKLRGQWGFQSFEGPSFQLRNARPSQWIVPAEDATGLVVGRDNSLHLQSAAAACVEDVSVQDDQGKPIKTSWKVSKPDELLLQVPLKDQAPGRLKVLVKSYGTSTADEVALQAYSEPAQLDRFLISAGSRDAVLYGTKLDQVVSLELQDVRFAPGKLSHSERDELSLAAPHDAKLNLRPDEKLQAHVTLKDGRVLGLETTVASQRPQVMVISKSVRPGNASTSAVRLADPDDTPQDGRLSFLVKTVVPKTFPKSVKLEVATADGAFHTMLSVSDGTLVLQDAQTALATIDPLKSLGPSAFGQLRFRPVEKDLKGDWQPLANLVRIPDLKEVRCPESPDKPCRLIGSNLFLIDSVASDAKFEKAISVPMGFLDSTLSVPRPNGTLLYVKLRDNPSSVNTIVLPVLPGE